MATAIKLTRKSDLIHQLNRARQVSDELFGILQPRALYERPIAERHRIVFYIGHLEAFDWNLFRGERPQLKSFDPVSDKLFAFGIDPVDGQLPSDQPRDWPSLAEVKRYNQRVRDELDDLLNSANLNEPQDHGAI